MQCPAVSNTLGLTKVAEQIPERPLSYRRSSKKTETVAVSAVDARMASVLVCGASGGESHATLSKSNTASPEVTFIEQQLRIAQTSCPPSPTGILQRVCNKLESKTPICCKNGVVYSRLLKAPAKSFFLFGPRGTGKSTWVAETLSEALTFDLLHGPTLVELLADSSRLETLIPSRFNGWVVIDEVQKAPQLLDEVHRLIEKRRLKFALTGSSARKLRRTGVNLLAGRALTLSMHPLCCAELRNDFDLKYSLKFGHLPAAYADDDPKAFLKSYVATYLKEEVQQEGLTRNLGAFARFLETASFSQASQLNISDVSRDAAIERKVIESYFGILEDLMLATRLRPFTKRAKRATVAHPKFYLFDAGVFRALRPQGPLDSNSEIDGQALETLVFQELTASLSASTKEYQMTFWRTRSGDEVDFILYGPSGFKAFEVTRAATLRGKDFDGLRAFGEEYPEAERFMLYGGSRAYVEHDVKVLPVEQALRGLLNLL